MKVVFNQNELEHLKEFSMYNHNFYKLPLTIDGCDILFVKWEDDMHEGDYILGTFTKEGIFAEKHLFYGDLDGNVDLVKNKLTY